MAHTPKLTILCVAQNCENYVEVFLRSAAANGFHREEDCRLVLFVGESTDNTERVCRSLADSIPVSTSVIYGADLSGKDRKRVAAIQSRNDGLFNEGMWDFLIQYLGVDTPYYAGIHIDVEFLALGLWDFLLNRLGDAAVAGIFDPGELYEDNGQRILSMPRFFPMVVVADRQRAETLKITWSRRTRIRGRGRIVEDNGAIALRRTLDSKIVIFGEDELQPFLRHFGFVWMSTLGSSLHSLDGTNSRTAVAKRLDELRSSAHGS